MRKWVPLIALLLSACNAGRYASADSACSTPPSAASNWKPDSGSAFRIALPPDFRRVAHNGFDSEVGVWESPSGTISYDYGAYSNELNAAPYASGRTCIVQIGARAARLVQYRRPNGDFAVGGHWDGFGERSLGTTSLTIEGSSRDSAVAAELWRSLWSVSFRR